MSWTDATLKGTNRNFITINVPVTFTIKSIIEFVNGQKRILTVSSLFLFQSKKRLRKNKASSLNSLQRKKINDPLIVSFHAHEDFDVRVSVTTVRAEHAGSLSWSELLFALKAADPLTVNESAEWADMEQIYTRLHFRGRVQQPPAGRRRKHEPQAQKPSKTRQNRPGAPLLLKCTDGL